MTLPGRESPGARLPLRGRRATPLLGIGPRDAALSPATRRGDDNSKRRGARVVLRSAGGAAGAGRGLEVRRVEGGHRLVVAGGGFLGVGAVVGDREAVVGVAERNGVRDPRLFQG